MWKLKAFIKRNYVKIIVVIAAILAVALACVFISQSFKNTDDIEACHQTLKSKNDKHCSNEKKENDKEDKKETKTEAKTEQESAAPDHFPAPGQNSEETAENADTGTDAEYDYEYDAENSEYASYDQTDTDTEPDKREYCTIYVSCAAINNDITRLKPQKRYLVPPDGVLLPRTTAVIKDGDSAFDVLYRILRENKIHMEFVKTPAYNSVYIEGIGNIYEFDCGELSGWQYSVNGEFPPYASSEYEVKDGDNIEFLYTCDLGRDIGGYYADQ